MNRSDLAAVLPSEWRWNGPNTKERVWLVLWNLEWKKIAADGRSAAIFRTADPTTQGWMNLLYSQMFGVWFTFTDSYRSASFPWTPKLYRHEKLESHLCGQRKWEEKGNKMARVLHGVVWKSGLRMVPRWLPSPSEVIHLKSLWFSMYVTVRRSRTQDVCTYICDLQRLKTLSGSWKYEPVSHGWWWPSGTSTPTWKGPAASWYWDTISQLVSLLFGSCTQWKWESNLKTEDQNYNLTDEEEEDLDVSPEHSGVKCLQQN